MLGNVTWDDANSVGNTLSNWFGEWDGAQFSYMYNRDALPNNSCCKRYYTASPLDIVKHIFTPWKIGKEFYINDIIIGYKNKTEDNALNNLTGYKRYLIKMIVDTLYASNIWFNKKAKKFIKESNADIVFLFAIPDAYRYNILKYFKRHTNAKIVEFIADDVYIQYCDNYGILNKVFKKRFPKMLRMADKLYGASELLCECYRREFGLKISPLYKGCSMSSPREEVNTPVKMIYAGNLRWGRAESLVNLVAELSKINEKGVRAVLSIYSNSYVDETIRKKLNIGESALYAEVSYERIKDLMSQSDIVLHVESFNEDQIKLVHYSFSTKIMDCLQSGSTMMIIGPKGISSVEYARKIPGAIIIDRPDALSEILEGVLKTPEDLIGRASQINVFAKKNHLLSAVRATLQLEFNELLK